MRNKLCFWIVAGVAVGTAVGLISKNIPAGVFIGTGTGMLLLVITSMETDKKINN